MAPFTAIALVACVSSRFGSATPPLYTLENQQAGTTALAVSADSRLLATGGWSGKVAIRNLQDASRLVSFQAHKDEVIGLVFLDERALLSGGRDGSVKKWTLNGSLVWEGQQPGRMSALSLNGRAGWLVTASEDGHISVWDSDTGTIVKRWRAHNRRIRAVVHAGGAALLASSDIDRTVKLWDARSGELLWESLTPTDARDLQFSADGQWLYGGGWFDLFRWQVVSGELQIIDTDHRGIINNLDLLDSSGALASVSRQTDSAVLIIDPQSGRTLQNLGSHALCGNRVTVSPDENYLISNSDDYSVSVWRIAPVQP